MHALVPITFLLTFSYTFSKNIFSTNNTIAHPESGLFLDYVGPYTPSDTVIHNTAIFPMTVHTCHFLPLAAAEKIPLCNITFVRTKRMILNLLSLGAGTISLGISTANNIQISNLRQQMAIVRQSLGRLAETTQLHTAQLVKIKLDQIQLVEQLDTTKKAP